MSRLGVEFSDDELEEMVNRSNLDILEAPISMLTHLLCIHKNKFCSHAFFHHTKDLKIFHKREISPPYKMSTKYPTHRFIHDHTVIEGTK